LVIKQHRCGSRVGPGVWWGPNKSHRAFSNGFRVGWKAAVAGGPHRWDSGRGIREIRRFL